MTVSASHPDIRSVLILWGSRLRLGALTLPVLLLTGCQNHHDIIDSTVDWYHRQEGGLIATQRPPPPGVNGPYPRVGLTPTTAPELPSPELRQDITNNLLQSRNFAQRMAVRNGTLTPDIPPPPVQAKTATPATPGKPGENGQPASPLPDGAMGAVLDAADSPEPTSSSTSPSPVAASPPSPVVAPTGSKSSKTPDEPEIAMPEFRGNAPKVATEVEGPLPDVPSAPPAAPSIAGFAVPSDANLKDPVKPDYDLSTPEGTIITFLPQSDQLAPGQDAALDKLVQSRGNALFYLHCSGETTSMDPADQAQAVQLGLLRARTLSAALTQRGVPASILHISSSAFGPGARVSTKG
ncbi:hypothetical protein [Acetobacter estunensis]|uniref:hypothetical protein n=1 Tax=Acetobacter estunensis TaxID=104097 RepID=UPI001C2D093A|nr:hypothetical protein [Acetobacter estunensis]MBV1835613.1 hypothetical protein [Acetobacter estunensis]MBV1836126.1 hypothetical protein [Acetobacter estunensis]